MFSRPVHFQEFLAHHGLIEDVYKAVKSPDLSDVVFTVWDIIRKTDNIPPLNKQEKTDAKSTALRNEGNQAYGQNKYQKALMCYNKALLFAPERSKALILAYSNRSALLHRVKAYKACLKDIDTCFALGCPDNIKEKLKKRRDDAHKNQWMDTSNEEIKCSFAKQYFKIKGENDCVPCTSPDVTVEYDKSMFPKIVAANDIKVGAVLAIEKAYVSHVDSLNSVICCYYCHKIDLNLKPCENCTFALFCSYECSQACDIEYHDVECKIMEILQSVSSGFVSRLALKAALKMSRSLDDISDFVSASHNAGLKRLNESSIEDIFCDTSDLSLLYSTDERHFLEGPLYNKSFICAVLMHYLDTVDGFIPWYADECDRPVFLRAFARVLMFLSLYVTNTSLVPSICIHQQQKTDFHNIPNYGWFAFTGKVKHSCNANLLKFGLNNKVALVATQAIKKGTELTVSYMPHWLESDTIDKQVRAKNMFVLHGLACNCLICTGEYKSNRKYQLTEFQKKNLRKLVLEDMRTNFMQKNIPDMFSKLCKTLAFLQDVPFSDEYTEVFRLFRKCILYAQDATTSNVILDYE